MAKSSYLTSALFTLIISLIIVGVFPTHFSAFGALLIITIFFVGIYIALLTLEDKKTRINNGYKDFKYRNANNGWRTRNQRCKPFLSSSSVNSNRTGVVIPFPSKNRK